MEIALRPPAPAEAVDPLTINPDPGALGHMYIGAREAYPDGMTLALATPKLPYQTLQRMYEVQRKIPGFSPIQFFDTYFTPPSAEEADYTAQPGQQLDDYIISMREKFIMESTDVGNFDVRMPYARSVAGIGRFGRHSFLWDGYQMARGYAADERWDLVQNMADNLEYQINVFGYPLNGSADFYATRAQPDYFAHIIRMMADRFGPEVLVRYLPALQKDHDGYWMDGSEQLGTLPLDSKAHAHRTLVRMPDGSFLNRYWDDGNGPRLESYKEDVELADLAVSGLKGALRRARKQKVYKDLRAGAASGWDFSSRWLADGKTLATINTTDIAPIDHNSMLVYQEETLALACEAAASMSPAARSEFLFAEDRGTEYYLEQAAKYRAMAQQRIAAINKYLWDPVEKIYRDYNFVDGAQTKIVSAAMAYPLYVGIANAEQTFGVARALEDQLLYDGGIIATTTEDSHEQWDGGVQGGTRSKNVWAPPNWAAMRGLARMAHILMQQGVDAEPLFELAEKVRRNYMWGIETAFKAHGIVPEKHRGDLPAILANGGEYAIVKVLGMPMETYRAMRDLDVRNRAAHITRLGELVLTVPDLGHKWRNPNKVGGIIGSPVGSAG